MDIIVALLTFCVGAIVMYYFQSNDREKRNLRRNIGNRASFDSTPIQRYPHENSNNKTAANKRKIRIYIDGCWDVMHSGHYNAIRQAKALGDILVVGVHSDEEIERNKREPVMKNKQRMAAVKACKWADEVVFDVPYVPTRQLLKTLNCDYVAHGDDIPICPNGHSAYHTVMDKLKIFKRTHGISTTHLIQRLIEAAQNNECITEHKSDDVIYDTRKSDEMKTNAIESTSSWSSFLASSSRISAFSNNKIPTKNDTVIYVDGIFDLFHIGHISALKKAKELGTFLYVGLYDDETIRIRKGKYFPLMNLQERVLNVLSCKYVDDVLIGAPWKITKQVLKSLNVKYVITSVNTQFAVDEFDRYDIPKQLGVFKTLETDSNFTTDILMQNIVENQHELKKQNKNRIRGAKQYINNHTYIQEKTK